MYRNKIKVKFNVVKVILKGLLQCDNYFYICFINFKLMIKICKLN